MNELKMKFRLSMQQKKEHEEEKIYYYSFRWSMVQVNKHQNFRATPNECIHFVSTMTFNKIKKEEMEQHNERNEECDVRVAPGLHGASSNILYPLFAITLFLSLSHYGD